MDEGALELGLGLNLVGADSRTVGSSHPACWPGGGQARWALWGEGGALEKGQDSFRELNLKGSGRQRYAMVVWHPDMHFPCLLRACCMLGSSELSTVMWTRDRWAWGVWGGWGRVGRAANTVWGERTRRGSRLSLSDNFQSGAPCVWLPVRGPSWVLFF